MNAAAPRRPLHTLEAIRAAGAEDQAATAMPVRTGERVAALLSAALQENRTERDAPAA
jgi:hypothetical protein